MPPSIHHFLDHLLEGIYSCHSLMLYWARGYIVLIFFNVIKVSIISLSRPFNFIKDVNDSKHIWKIVVRITQLWYVQIPPKPGHLEMILMDSKGEKIQVSVKKDEFNQWSQSLLENKTYVMHNFNFTAGTTLKRREFPDIPELEYDFKKFSDIISGNFQSDLLIDVIGVFDKLIFSQTQSNLKKEAHAIKFLNFYNNLPNRQPLVILLTNARVKDGQGNYPPTVSNSWSGSKLLIDEEITNFQNYKDKFVSFALCNIIFYVIVFAY
ncbi:hypothetical protein Lal_00038620 [Lupinus albus]|nr:hypothetical protein Lal_00038620 [Lupinus albus]